jgi:hypothetical protein
MVSFRGYVLHGRPRFRRGLALGLAGLRQCEEYSFLLRLTLLEDVVLLGKLCGGTEFNVLDNFAVFTRELATDCVEILLL